MKRGAEKIVEKYIPNQAFSTLAAGIYGIFSDIVKEFLPYLDEAVSQRLLVRKALQEGFLFKANSDSWASAISELKSRLDEKGVKHSNNLKVVKENGVECTVRAKQNVFKLRKENGTINVYFSLGKKYMKFMKAAFVIAKPFLRDDFGDEITAYAMTMFLLDLYGDKIREKVSVKDFSSWIFLNTQDMRAFFFEGYKDGIIDKMRNVMF